MIGTKNRNKLNRKSILVIDEAGMVGTRQMDQLIDHAQKAKSKIIIVGDTAQTQAVEAGGAFRGIIERVGTSRLKEVWRQKDDWQKEATRLLSGSREDIIKALDMFDAKGNISEFNDSDKAASAMLKTYLRRFDPGKTSIMIAHTNKEVETLNTVCRYHLKEKTDFIDEEDIKVETSSGVKYFSKGDRILFLKNEKSMNVKNGTFGVIKNIDEYGKMLVDLGDDRSIVVDTHYYNSLTYGYATTVHKLQGATLR